MRIYVLVGMAIFLLGNGAVRGEEKKLPNRATAHFRNDRFHFAQHGLPIAVSPNGSLLAMGSPDVDVVVWNIAERKKFAEFKGAEGSIDTVVFSPDGKLLAAGGDEGKVWVWNVATQEKVHELKHGKILRAMAIDQTGKYLASAGQGPLVLWDLENGKEVRKFTGHENFLSCVAFSPDGTQIAAGGSDHALRFWNVATGKVISVSDRHEGIVSDVVYSEDGRYVVSSSWDQTVRMHSAATHKELCEVFRVPRGQGGLGVDGGIQSRFYSIAISPDGQSLAIAGDDAKVRICEIPTRKVYMELEGHESGVTDLAFTPDGRGLFSSGKDLEVYLWDLTRPEKETKEPSELKPEELEALWNQLKDQDAGKAHRALLQLLMTPKGTLQLLKQNMKPAQAIQEDRIKQLIALLDHDDYTTREKASQDLENAGAEAEQLVRAKLATDLPNVEMRRRLENVLTKIEDHGLGSEQVRALRAVKVLEWINTPDAKNLLEVLAKGSAGSQVTQAARSALSRLTKARK